MAGNGDTEEDLHQKILKGCRAELTVLHRHKARIVQKYNDDLQMIHDETRAVEKRMGVLSHSRTRSIRFDPKHCRTHSAARSLPKTKARSSPWTFWLPRPYLHRQIRW